MDRTLNFVNFKIVKGHGQKHLGCNFGGPFSLPQWSFKKKSVECSVHLYSSPILGLKVLIELHAAPGSQNGFDNSGRMGPIGM